MTKRRPREVTGVLLTTPSLGNLGRLHFLRTKDGTYWRLEVEPERVRWLDGLAVHITGVESGGLIRVDSVVQA